MTKIEWCDMTWNPVWGCLSDCNFCYARKIAKRFGEKIALKEFKYLIKEIRMDDYDLFGLGHDLKNFKPTFLESNFNKKFPKKPSRIFVNSMSDIAFWKNEWMEKVLNKIKEYPDHTFLFLTKDAYVYNNYNFSQNCYLGVTITKQEYVHDANYYIFNYQGKINKTFISLEPIQEKITLYSVPDWIIIGAETGNRKNKIIPEKSWIEEFRNIDIPVFMKNNLKNIVGDNLRQEFPK